MASGPKPSAYWASKLSKDQLDEFREHFEMFDEDGDGTITTKELGTVMKNLGQNPSQTELKHMISEVDEDGTGDIDFDEFCTLMARQMGLDEPEEEPVDHKEAFKLFDQNSKGNISARELRLVLGDISESLSSDEIDQLIEEIDPDSDGKINYRDFCKTLLF